MNHLNRRTLLRSLSLAPLAATPLLASPLFAAPLLAEAKLPPLKLDKLEVFQVKANFKEKVLYGHNWVMLRLTTTRGVTGIGEASQSGDDAQMLLWVKKYFDMLRAREGFDPEWFYAATRVDMATGGEPAAVAASALEHCLWDIQGKRLGVPCYELFGGKLRNELRLYGNINRSTTDRSPEGFAKMAQIAVAAGLTAVKLAPFDEIPHGETDAAVVEAHVKTAIARADAVRAAIGPRVDLSLDVHSRLLPAAAMELLPRLAHLNLFWLEEATPPDGRPAAQNADRFGDNYTALTAVRRGAKFATAGGESLHGVTEFYPYIRADAASVYMPDVKVCGGMLQMKKIAALTEGAACFVSPHSPAGPVGQVVAAHVMASAPSFNILEMSFGENAFRAELISPPEDISSGSLKLSTRPGLGIELNEKAIAKYRA